MMRQSVRLRAVFGGPSIIANRFHSPTRLQPRDQAPALLLFGSETKRTQLVLCRDGRSTIKRHS
jgi:hypothetical protein